MSFATSFYCPQCHRILSVGTLYQQLLNWASFGASGLAAYLLGARWGLWLFFLLVGYFPFGIVVATVARHRFPPRIRLTANDPWEELHSPNRNLRNSLEAPAEEETR